MFGTRMSHQSRGKKRGFIFFWTIFSRAHSYWPVKHCKHQSLYSKPWAKHPVRTLCEAPTAGNDWPHVATLTHFTILQLKCKTLKMTRTGSSAVMHQQRWSGPLSLYLPSFALSLGRRFSSLCEQNRRILDHLARSSDYPILSHPGDKRWLQSSSCCVRCWGKSQAENIKKPLHDSHDPAIEFKMYFLWKLKQRSQFFSSSPRTRCRNKKQNCAWTLEKDCTVCSCISFAVFSVFVLMKMNVLYYSVSILQKSLNLCLKWLHILNDTKILQQNENSVSVTVCVTSVSEWLKLS